MQTEMVGRSLGRSLVRSAGRSFGPDNEALLVGAWTRSLAHAIMPPTLFTRCCCASFNADSNRVPDGNADDEDHLRLYPHMNFDLV